MLKSRLHKFDREGVATIPRDGKNNWFFQVQVHLLPSECVSKDLELLKEIGRVRKWVKCKMTNMALARVWFI